MSWHDNHCSFIHLICYSAPNSKSPLSFFAGRDVLELGLARVEDEDSEAVAACAEADSAMSRALDRLDDSLRIVACGYLWKMSRGGGGGGKSDVGGTAPSRWMRRWFVLRADSCLYFFKTEHVRLPLKSISKNSSPFGVKSLTLSTSPCRSKYQSNVS